MTGKRPVSRNQQVGAQGEALAWQWYRTRGYTLQARNWRSGLHGELDIICSKNDTVVFVEVKTRTSDRFGTGLDAVTVQKQHRIRRLAMMWLKTESQRYFPVLRFDVVAVDGKRRVTVVTDAF